MAIHEPRVVCTICQDVADKETTAFFRNPQAIDSTSWSYIYEHRLKKELKLCKHNEARTVEGISEKIMDILIEMHQDKTSEELLNIVKDLLNEDKKKEPSVSILLEKNPMKPLKIYNNVDVKLRNSMTGDDLIVAAARASVDDWTENIDMNAKSNIGLINYLMREKHGSPFEHNSMTFFVKAPIFVFREIHRHRMASYNEMSGRYTELPGEFYIPDRNRNIVNVGSSAKPKMAPGSDYQWLVLHDAHMKAYECTWEQYHRMLDVGIASEMARDVLPVGIYSQMVMTLNLRSAFNFLSLRTHVETAQHVSRPQREIEMVAEQIEVQIKDLFPVAYRMFNKHGRVAP